MARRGVIIGAGATVLALATGLLIAGTASADEGGGGDTGNGGDDNTGGGTDNGTDGGGTEDDTDTGGEIDTGDVDLVNNWGGVPMEHRVRAAAAEKASGIRGFARYSVICAWGAWRAGKDPVSPAEAAELAKNPDWCRPCHNTSASERAASKQALDRVTKPKSEGGAYDKPWPMPADYAGWADGSYGYFDLLGGAQVFAGIHNDFTPLINQKATVLYEWRPQFFVAGYIVYRCIHREDLPVLAPKASDTWANIRACWATPEGFKAWKKGQSSSGALAAAKARDNFFIRAKELGIDPDAIANPDPKTWGWPGAKTYWEQLAANGLQGGGSGGGGGGGGGNQGGDYTGITTAEKAAVEKIAAERPTSTILAPPPYDKQRQDGTQTERQFLTNVAFYTVYFPNGGGGPLPAKSPLIPAWNRMKAYMDTLPLGGGVNPGQDQAPNPGNADEKVGEYTVRRIVVGPAGSGNVVWLLHGLNGDLGQLQGLIADAPDGEYVLVTRGSSWIATPNGDWSNTGDLNQMAGQLADRGFKLLQLRQTLHPNDTRPWVVIGYSQGGQVAYNLLGASPQSGLKMPDALAIGAARLPGTPLLGSQRSTQIRAIVGSADNTVPTMEAQAAAEIFAAAGFKTSFSVVPGVGHSIIGLGAPLRQTFLAVLPQILNA